MIGSEPFSEAIIFEADGADPTADRIVTESDGKRTTIIGVPGPDAAARVAVDLVDGGAETVQLCGGLGPIPAARVAEAIGHRVPVGFVGFGIESLKGAAAYGDAWEARREAPVIWALIYVQPGVDPTADRVVREHGGERTVILAVPEPTAAARAAAALVDDGVQLIELYRGFGPTETAHVIDAAGGRVPVGMVTFGAIPIARSTEMATRGEQSP